MTSNVKKRLLSLLKDFDKEKKETLEKLNEEEEGEIENVKKKFKRKREEIQKEYDLKSVINSICSDDTDALTTQPPQPQPKPPQPKPNSSQSPSNCNLSLVESCLKTVDWVCKACNYRLCKVCIKNIDASVRASMKKSIKRLKLQVQPLKEAKRDYMRERMVCPHCRSTPLIYEPL